MVKFIGILIFTVSSFIINAQNPIGAWEAYSTTENGEKIKSVVIFANGYQSISVFNATNGKFISTNGGTWNLEGDMMTEKVEFDTNKPDRVGTESSFKVAITDSSIQIVGTNNKFSLIDNGMPGALQGSWLMSGRVVDGKEQIRDTSGPRKTMKILSGTRFQWIAYNTATKEFSGTGGGTYTTKDGEYVETIEFFSKDDSKVGASLKFNYKLNDHKWNHSGFSSKGDPLNEIWSKREY